MPTNNVYITPRLILRVNLAWRSRRSFAWGAYPHKNSAPLAAAKHRPNPKNLWRHKNGTDRLLTWRAGTSAPGGENV